MAKTAADIALKIANGGTSTEALKKAEEAIIEYAANWANKVYVKKEKPINETENDSVIKAK